MKSGKQQLKTKNWQRGFTLIELIVSLGVFMVVMTITLAAFLNIADIQKKTEAFRKVNDNLNFAMEVIMREIREGKNYCSTGCVTDFTFTNKSNETIVYKLNTDLPDDYYIERKVNGIPQRMTSDGVAIEKLSFFVTGAGDDDKQPLVTITIGGVSGIKEKLKSRLNLQATVSQRKLDS